MFSRLIKKLFHKHNWTKWNLAKTQLQTIAFGYLQVDYERVCKDCGDVERVSSHNNPNNGGWGDGL